jgi:hypothetical protein
MSSSRLKPNDREGISLGEACCALPLREGVMSSAAVAIFKASLTAGLPSVPYIAQARRKNLRFSAILSR